ncbi:MAG: glycosyltransferase family 87 protein [Desulfobacterales bacterium]
MERCNYKHTSPLNTRHAAAVVAGLGILSAAIYCINFDIDDFFPILSGLEELKRYIAIFMFLSVLYLIGVFAVLKLTSGDQGVWRLTGIIIFLAVVFRLALVVPEPAVLSNDIYRYVWDGRVQQNGINPYLYPPESAELEDLRDDRIFPNINRKEYPTVYPAGAQVFFRLFHLLVGDSVGGYKAIMVFFDISTLLILTALLQNRGFNPSRIIIYAWNPLVLYEISYSGHLEGLVVFLMTAALYLHAVHKKIPAIVMLAISAAVKLYPALLLAAFVNRGDRIKGLAVFAATILLLYVPFVGAGGKIAGFLPVYLKNPYESFNLGLKYFLMHLIPWLDYDTLSMAFIITLVIAGLIVFLRQKNGMEVLRYGYILTGLLMILMPASLHPWYVIMLIPFLVFYPGAAWLIFTCTVALSYLKYVPPEGKMPDWILLAEYLPLFALLSAGYILKRMPVAEKLPAWITAAKKET